MGKESIFQVSHYNWGRVAYDPLEQQLSVEVPKALRSKYKVSGRLAPLEKMLSRRQKIVDVSGILSSPEFPYGMILSDLVKWADPERKLGAHLEDLTSRERLELAVEALNHSDFQFYLEYYALSRYLSNIKDPVLVMEDGDNIKLINLHNFTAYNEEFAITFNFGFVDDLKACYILAGALYESEYDKDNLPESEEVKMGDIDVVGTLNTVRVLSPRAGLNKVSTEDELFKVLSRRIYYRVMEGQSLSLKVNGEKIRFFDVDDFFYHKERGIIEFKARLEGSDDRECYYTISGDMLYEGCTTSRDELVRIGMVDIPDAVGVTEK